MTDPFGANYRGENVLWFRDDQKPGPRVASLEVAQTSYQRQEPTSDRYQSVRFLGRGGFGSVDAVFDKSNTDKVLYARKRFRYRNQTLLEEFKEEASMLEGLHFRHIVQLVETYTWNSCFCIIMLPVAECNMSDYLTTLDAMELGTERDELRRRALQWPGCLIRAFDYLHDKRTKHRDVKPSNILIKGGTVYLADFGISKMVDGDETTGSYGYVGAHTRNYSAPEVLEEEDETRRGRSVDIYSLGCIFLELATVLIAPPHSRERFANLRLDTSGSLAYAEKENELLNLQWIQKLWADWISQSDEIIANANSMVSLAFFMMDPEPRTRITAVQLVILMAASEYFCATILEKSCDDCKSMDLSDHDRVRIYAAFKSEGLRLTNDPELALQLSSPATWTSAKRA